VPHSALRTLIDAENTQRAVSDQDAVVIGRRKDEHIELVATGDVDTRGSAGWTDVELVHNAVPELSSCDVNLTTELLGHTLNAPLVIAGMTGGHPRAGIINSVLARAAERHALAMGVGSQRAALVDASLADTYRVARRDAPGAFLIANVGAAQLIAQDGVPGIGLDGVREAVEMIAAQAVAIHLNFLEESIQPEGDRSATGCLDEIATIAAQLSVPLLAKETGAGLSRGAALRLRDAGAQALDVGGSGGTSFAAVESMRAHARGDERGSRLGALLRDWGIPTAVSLLAARAASLPLIATGGVRSGLDAAKALALGATAVGIGAPILRHALEGEEALEAWLTQFLEELRTVMFLTGSRTLEELRSRPVVILGRTKAWAEQLGYELPARRDGAPDSVGAT
jgi:isopentenyl-diphosphate Delta-isomerase